MPRREVGVRIVGRVWIGCRGKAVGRRHDGLSGDIVCATSESDYIFPSFLLVHLKSLSRSLSRCMSRDSLSDRAWIAIVLFDASVRVG